MGNPIQWPCDLTVVDSKARAKPVSTRIMISKRIFIDDVLWLKSDWGLLVGSPPLCPFLAVVFLDEMLWGDGHIVGAHIVLSEEKPADERFHLWELALWKLTMSMTSHDAVAKPVSDSKLLPHFLGGIAADVGGWIGEPFIVGVAEDEACPRAAEGNQLMVVVR